MTKPNTFHESGADPVGAMDAWNTMIDAAKTAHTLDTCRLDALALIAREHIRTMESSIQSAVGHLQTSMSWSQSVVAVGISAVLAVSDPMMKAAAIALSMVLTASCCTRTAKNYINVIRFGILHRRSLLLAAAHAANSSNLAKQLDQWQIGVRDYYLAWISPVSRQTVMRKSLLEFHYVYMFAVQLGIAIKLWLDNSSDGAVQRVIVIGVTIAVLEVAHFLFASPYLKEYREDADMTRQH